MRVWRLMLIALLLGGLVDSVRGAHSLDWHTMDGGGGTSRGVRFSLRGTIGQPDAGSAIGSTYGLGVGFWGNAPVVVEPTADIELTKWVDNGNPIEGATVTFTVLCYNHGPGAATGVEVTDLLPAGVTYESDDAAGSYTYGTGVWDVGSLIAGGWLRLNIVASVDDGTHGQTIINTAAVRSIDQVDPAPANDGAQATITVGFGVHYVDLNGSHVSPFVNWATAATNVQAAVDVAQDGGLVLVSNGVYAVGGRSLNAFAVTSRVFIAKDIVVQSVNGPEQTHIVGAVDPVTTNGPGALRCAYISGDAMLEGFTLRDGHTYGDPPNGESELWDPEGGGVMLKGGGMVSNCVIRDCSSHETGGGVYVDSGSLYDCLIVSNWSGYGGGIYVRQNVYASRCRILNNQADGGGGGAAINEGGYLDTCLVADNRSEGKGGGVSLSWGGNLTFCTIAGNHADEAGGGLYVNDRASIANTILYGNTSGTSDTNWFNRGSGSFYFCCVAPDPGGSGNLVSDPLFVDAASGDYHLQGGSPCIDALAPGSGSAPDLDGIPRPLDGDNNSTATTDMGTYEYAHENADKDGDGMGDGYEARHGLNLTYAGDASENPDGDPHSNLQEAVADTDPRDADSYLRITDIQEHPAGVRVHWLGGVRARQYLESRAVWGAGDWVAIHTNEPPTPVKADFTDRAEASKNYYRVKAESMR